MNDPIKELIDEQTISDLKRKVQSLEAENAELKRQLDEISEIEEKNTPTAYSSGWNDLLDKIHEIINE